MAGSEPQPGQFGQQLTVDAQGNITTLAPALPDGPELVAPDVPTDDAAPDEDTAETGDPA